jgi:hypothetical protein
VNGRVIRAQQLEQVVDAGGRNATIEAGELRPTGDPQLATQWHDRSMHRVIDDTQSWTAIGQFRPLKRISKLSV